MKRQTKAALLIALPIVIVAGIVSRIESVETSAFTHPVYGQADEDGTLVSRAVCSRFLDIWIKPGTPLPPVRPNRIGPDRAYLYWYTLPTTATHEGLIEFSWNGDGYCPPEIEETVFQN